MSVTLLSVKMCGLWRIEAKPTIQSINQSINQSIARRSQAMVRHTNPRGTPDGPIVQLWEAGVDFGSKPHLHEPSLKREMWHCSTLPMACCSSEGYASSALKPASRSNDGPRYLSGSRSDIQRHMSEIQGLGLAIRQGRTKQSMVLAVDETVRCLSEAGLIRR